MTPSLFHVVIACFDGEQTSAFGLLGSAVAVAEVHQASGQVNGGRQRDTESDGKAVGWGCGERECECDKFGEADWV